jgi:methyl halide transferase
MKTLHRFLLPTPLIAAIALTGFALVETSRAQQSSTLETRPIESTAFSSRDFPKAHFKPGELFAFEENRQFTYAAGEIVSGDVRVLRRIILLKPATYVIEDIVIAPAPNSRVHWPLYSTELPETSGREIRIAEQAHELRWEILLPHAALLTTRRLSEPDPRGKFRLDIELESAAETPEGAPRLLHVVQTSARGEMLPADAKLVRKGSVLELTVQAEGKTFALSLPPVREHAGHIKISNAESVALERRLFPSGLLPDGEEGMNLLERWDSAYRTGGQAPWDTGRPSTELSKLVEAGTLPPGRSLELGCGTGTSSIYLAKKGFQATAMDIAPSALRLAEEKGRQAEAPVHWVLANVLAPPVLEPFDVIFDRGCYHGVRRQNAAGYVETLRRLSKPGTRILILAGNANEAPPHYGPPRVKEDELRADFAEDFEIESLRETRFDTADPQRPGAMAWAILLRRK